MTSEQLRHFLQTCKYMSFTEAADHLYLHPTSVSRSVSSLEKELGVSLFERRHRGLALTDAGAYFMGEAEQILFSMENAAAHVRNIGTQTGEKLTVRITLNGYPAVADLFTRYLTRFPHAALDLGTYMPVDGLDICRQLDDGSIDLYFSYGDNIPSFSVSHYNLRKIRAHRILLMVGKSHPLAKRENVSLEDLQGETIFSGDFHMQDIEQALRATMAERNLRSANFSHPMEESELFVRVSAGQGVSFFVDIPAAAAAWDCLTIPFADFSYEKDLYMIWLDKNTNPSLRQFLDIAQSV